MAKYRMITMVNAKPDRDAEMNDWYENVHVPELLAVPGIISGQRLRIRNSLVPAEPAWTYMAIFEIDADDPMAVLAEVRARTEAGKMGSSDAYQLNNMGMYEVVSLQLEAAG